MLFQMRQISFEHDESKLTFSDGNVQAKIHFVFGQAYQCLTSASLLNSTFLVSPTKHRVTHCWERLPLLEPTDVFTAHMITFETAIDFAYRLVLGIVALNVVLWLFVSQAYGPVIGITMTGFRASPTSAN